MSGSQSPITINDAMKRIRERAYLLPAFQREYVWYPKQVEELFDSLMRGYPISSMLFWEVRDESKRAWKFYEFLEFYREYYHTHNKFYNTQNHKDFEAILDGQQRLTSLYLALFGHYDIHKYRKKWEDDDRVFDICNLYFNLTQSKEPENPNVEYEFLWLDKNETKEQTFFIDDFKQKWFKCADIYKYETSRVRKLSREADLTEAEEEKLDLFHQTIFDKQMINFYRETDQNPDKAVNIFIRINSGGTHLDYSDILFSIAIANWKKIDARTEINGLVDRINQDFSFNINKDLILKGFLFLFHNNIKFKINSFDKGFIESIEEKWENIKDCFIETFRLLRKFGLEARTLSSNNAVLPILYFIYHKNLTNSIVDSVSQKQNRELIKKWLLRVIVLKPLGGSGDSVLTNMRKAFIKDFKQDNIFFDREMGVFPAKGIEKEAKYTQSIDDEYIENNIIELRKNSPEAFAVLSILFNNFKEDIQVHIDHLHPISAYKNKTKEERKKYEDWADTLPNLQLLEGGENKSKNDMPLEKWVEKNCGNNRSKFLKEHLIPDIDLSLENFYKFYEERKTILIKELIEILNK